MALGNKEGGKVSMRKIITLFVTLFIFLGIGCGHMKQKVEVMKIKPFQPTNVYTMGRLAGQITRVAVLPVYYKLDTAPFLSFVDENFHTEISRQGRFEVRAITRKEMKYHFGKEQYNIVDDLPEDFLAKLQKEFRVDAVLLTDLTNYEPYRPLRMGVRCKLVELSSAEVFWAFDTTFNGGDRSVQLAVERFQNFLDMNVSKGHGVPGTLQSPRQFSKYVANAVYSTLPQR